MTAIYGTLGPACADLATLEEMFRMGMTGIRINLSHTGLREAEPAIAMVHEAARRCGIKPELLIDMQGPEIRIPALKASILLESGTTVTLGGDGIPVPEIVLPWLQPGQQLLLDDGKLLLEVTENTPGGIKAHVLRGGELKGRKSLALPGSGIYPPAITDTDRENIRLAAQYGVTGLMQPFVRSADDLKAVRRELDGAGGQDIRILAKIEDMNGVHNLDSLIPGCDEIVIARGDLGNAMPLWELPGVQKQISAECKASGRAFMVVTQMLASMEHSPVPTRAEVSDIFNAVTDGAASVMVTGETAAGAYPAEVMKYLANTVREAEKFINR